VEFGEDVLFLLAEVEKALACVYALARAWSSEVAGIGNGQMVGGECMFQ
jgi:hypothetical protein